MSSWILLVFWALAPASAATVRTAPPAHVPHAPQLPIPLASVAAAASGGCDYRWQGGRVTESELLDRAVVYLEKAVARIGGPENVTDKNMPVANLEAAPNAPYICVRITIFALQRAGYSTLRIDNPNSGAQPWAQPIIFYLPQSQPEGPPPPVDPVRNRLDLAANGQPRWNGQAIDFPTLRQYCDLTQEMNPVAWIDVDVADAAPWQQVRPLIAIVWRSHASRVQLMPYAGGTGFATTLSADRRQRW